MRQHKSLVDQNHQGQTHPASAVNSPIAAPAPASAIPTGGPPGASGNLRGDPSLAGYYPAEPTSILDTEVPTSLYSLAAGQTANPTLGLPFDLSEIPLPQPIRGGTNSPDDPGPRKSMHASAAVIMD